MGACGICCNIKSRRKELPKNSQFEYIEESMDKSINEEVESKILNNDKKEKLEEEVKKEIIKEINERQSNLIKENKIHNEIKNENLEIIEKVGKSKSLSDEEITKEKNKTQLLEDMNAMGIIMKEQILEEKKTNPNKFYSTKEIIAQKDSEDNNLYALGIFAKILEDQGMVIAIEKNNYNNEEEEKISKESAKTSLQFLINGMYNIPKYNLHFDFGNEKNTQLLNDENERKKFHDKLRRKLSNEYNINEEDIIITFPRKGSYEVTIIFKSKDFLLNENDLLQKFQKYKDELGQLKKIESGIIISGCKLNESMLDYRGNNRDGGWAGKGEKRGGEEYFPPNGWVGYGLNVLDNDRFGGDNTWIGMDNIEGEWCVAYHGVARGQSPGNVSKITGLICKTGFKPSSSGAATSDDDLRHPGEKCGLGVYCSPDIQYIEDNNYAGITQFNGESYKCALMLRVNPEKIRQSKYWPKEYILEPVPDEIRPYRILLKKC